MISLSYDDISEQIILCFTCAAALLICMSALRLCIHRKHFKLPPGPRRSFWKDNRDVLPWSEPWKVYSEWTNTFGPLVYLYVYGRDVVVVNSLKTATDLLEKSRMYNRRPTWSMVALSGRANNVVFMDYSERQRDARAVIQAAVNPRGQRLWRSMLEEETQKFIRDMVKSPELYRVHLKRYTTSFATRFTFGFSADNERIKQSDEVAAHTLTALKPGHWIVDAVPALIYLPHWFPGMGFKRWAANVKAQFEEFTAKPYGLVRDQVIQGVDTDCMVSRALKDIFEGKSRFTEDAVLSASCSVPTAGADTTAAAISTFLLLMCAHQDVQDKAFAEITEVIGVDRLPTPVDQPALPYIDAIYKEILRSNPVAPILPRAATSAQQYDGYHIPKDTWVMFNLWAMTHDSEVYPTPDAFDPDRFLRPTIDGEPVKDPRDIVFGFGKRLCPGLNLASTQIPFVMSQLLSLFQVKPGLDADGNEVPAIVEYTSTFISIPKLLKCRLILRSTPVAQHLSSLYKSGGFEEMD